MNLSPQDFKALLDALERIAKALEMIAKRKPVSKYVIEESHKCPGCYNIYNMRAGSRVKYFAEDDDKNYKRAINWVEENEI